MLHILFKNNEKTKYFALFALSILLFFLITVVYKNDEKINNNEKNISFRQSDLLSLKKFFINT